MYKPILKNHVHSANKFIFEDNYSLHFFGPVNDLAPMKNCPGVLGRSN